MQESKIRQERREESKELRARLEVKTWEEGDRLGIWIEDKLTGMTVWEVWDDHARGMIEEGFYDPRKQETVLDYLLVHPAIWTDHISEYVFKPDEYKKRIEKMFADAGIEPHSNPPLSIKCPHCGDRIPELKYQEWSRMNISDHHEEVSDTGHEERVYYCIRCGEEIDHEELHKQGVF